MNCGQWMSELEEVRLASSFEIPYASVKERTVTARSARVFGYDLARAVQEYLNTL